MGLIRKVFEGFAWRACALAAGLALAAQAIANPNGPSVVSGQAMFQATGKTLTVTNTSGAIINWQGFSIRADELTRFLQQSPVSTVLNRVISASPSEILGRLQSNGRVFLVNPNGIVFGPGSQVDVAGFAASTLNISNADFASGRHVFTGKGTEGRILSQGEIVASAGGGVILIAPQVENSGIIRAPSGEIVLAAGSTVRLLDANFPSIQVEVSAEGRDLSLGNLAGAGKVFAFVVRQSGLVNASAASVGDGGRVVLKSAGEIQVAASSRIEADGARGGGNVAVIAEQVRFSGTINARATRSGDGGFVEVSGRQSLVFAGTVDTRAATGRDGTLLIDPARITVVAGSTGMPPALADGTWAANEDSGSQTLGATDLTNLLKTTSVTLQATESVVVAGNAVIEAAAAGRALTLQAPKVVFQGAFRAAQSPADLNIRAASAQVTQGARIELAGGKLEVTAKTANIEPALAAERQGTLASLQRVAANPPAEISRLRQEVLAEVERDNARLAEAMNQSCARTGAPRQGCTLGAPARRFAFAG